MFNLFERTVALAISAGLLLTIMLQVTDRFIFGGGLQLAWTEEIARILLLWLTFWGAILVQKEDSHIRLEIVVRVLPQRARAFAFVLIDLAVVAFLLVVIFSGVPYALHELELTLPGTGLPRSVFVLAVIVGSFFMAAHALRNLLLRVRRLRSARVWRDQNS